MQLLTDAQVDIVYIEGQDLSQQNKLPSTNNTVANIGAYIISNHHYNKKATGKSCEQQIKYVTRFEKAQPP